MKNTPLYITILFCLLISIAKAEITENVFDIQHLTTNDGLSSQRVFSIIEDKHGVIWVATKEGIDRYNGNSIKNYILSGEFSYGDMAGRVLRLYYSEQYGLWVYDQTGKIFKYLERNDTFSPFYALEQMIPGPITLNNFFIDESEVFWFGTQKGVYKKQQDGAIECVLSDKYITDIITVDNTTVIASSQGIFQINKDSIRVINQITDNLYIQSLYYDKTREQLWVGTFNDGLAVLNMKTDEWLYIESDEKNRNPIRSIIDYDSQFILVGIDGGGVYTVNKETHKTKQLMCNSDNIFRTRLLGNGVYTVLKDSQRNIWVGSYTGGVSVAILLKTPYTKFQHEFSNNNTLANNNVNDIEENSDGNLWFSTDSGISICDMKTGKWTHILNEIVATSISRGEDGTMWVGTYGKGVYQFNKEGKKLAHLTTQTGDLTTNYTLAIHFDDKANLWIGGLGGKLVLLNQKNKYRQLFDIEWVQSIQSVYNDTLAVATTSGLYLIDKSDKKVHEYASNVQYKNMNMSSYIISMLFNDDKTVWLGTDGGGLCLYNILTNDIQILTTSDGLPSNDIYSLHRDKNARIWASTSKGLAMIKNFKVSNYNYLEYVDKLFNKTSFCQLNNGDVVYGSTSGAVLLNMNTLNCSEFDSPVRITGVKVKNLPIEQTERVNNVIYDMLNEDHIKLKYKYNSFSASYESINYCYRRDIVYQHILEGYDKSWSSPSNQGLAQYTNVLAGSYKFKVRSLSVSDGKVISEEELMIDIAQPWWNSIYARIVYLLLLVCVFYLILRYKSNQIRKKHDAEKLNYFINTAHDIRTPVTLIMAPLEDLSKENSLSADAVRLLDLARNNTNKLHTLITRLLEFEKVEKYKEQFILTSQCLNTILSKEAVCFQSYCDKKHQQLKLKIPEKDIYVKADKYMLEILLDNLISNACKYTPEEGIIELRLTVAKNMAVIEIEDNGIGIPKTANKHLLKNVYRAENAKTSEEYGNGFGLLQVQRIVTALRGEISYQSEEGKGTTFKIILNCTDEISSQVNINNESIKRPTLIDDFTNIPAKQSIDASNLKKCDNRDTLLIVEDNESLRNYLCSIFEKEYRIIDKADGQAALDYLSEEYPDLIISDVMMPGIQGDELCHRIKSNPETEGIPLVLLTAKVNHDAIVTGLKNGADDYIPKPFSTEILKLKVQGLLENRRRQRNYLIRQSLYQVNNGNYSNLITDHQEEITTETRSTEYANPLQINVDISDNDREFVKKATQIVLDNIDDTEFTINMLCQKMGMSRTLFFSRLKSLTGKAPQDFIRMIRLQKSVELLRSGMTVNEVACETGFVNTKYFSTLFKKEFGVQPSKFIK